MAPIIHLVRHGQGLHNVAGCYDLPDPLLTKLGQQQCEALKTSFGHSRSLVVFSSPLCRALQTAFLTFRSPIIALPDAQETSDDPCDIGTNPYLLRDVAEDMGWAVDLSLLQDGWNDKSLRSRYSPADGAIRARARELRIYLRKKCTELGNVEIVLVTHGSFLHYLTGDWEDASKNPATGWNNCETRSYVLDDSGDDYLIETPESRSKRGMTHPMYGPEQQDELFARAMQSWGEHGLQRPDQL